MGPSSDRQRARAPSAESLQVPASLYRRQTPARPGATGMGIPSWRARKPIKIGGRSWIGFNVIILKGVTVGDGSVVGAGSVVTGEIPPGVIAIGNPCRVIRSINP